MSGMPLMAQLTGDGSFAHPYSGFLAGDLTISGTKYFNGNIYVDNETLTVEPGAKLVALQYRAAIFVTATGRILAVGSGTSPITFTADTDLDGITGEPEDSWGNITISSSGANQFAYCTFERGRRDHVKFGLMGGGLKIGTSTVTVTNCTFRSCLASKGGAIAVVSGTSPSISRCTFTSNNSIDQGGAVYVEASSAPVFSNCYFNGNSSSSLTLKGGTIASVSSSPRIVNSTIVYSTAAISDGTSIYLENSSGSILVNNVVWGGSNHISLNGTSSSVLASNAIEGASFTGNITLNSSNTAADGPNFANPAGGDFRPTYVSPLRDSGAESYSGVTIPTVDITNAGRVYIPDIGALENIYSRWTGALSNVWNHPKNWSGNHPPGTTNVIIPAGMANYPTSVPGPSFTLNAGLEMIIEPGARVTFASLTNNGTIELQASATASASMITDSFSGTGGSFNVQMFLTGAPPDIDRWHYIASPATVSKTVVTDVAPENLMSYDESKVVTDVIEGWQWHDGYDGTTGFSTLDAKKGYNVLLFSDATVEYSNLTTITRSMGQINLPFSGSGGDTSLYGYALIGNSLTCGINWDMVTRSDAVNVRNAIYITKDNEVASYVNGVGTNGGTAHIPPLQGFFVKTRATGTFITIPDNAREHNSTVRFKSSQIIPLIRLTLVSPVSDDETVVRLESASTTRFDNDYDAGKMFLPEDNRAQIFSVLKGEYYSINSIPWPEKEFTIPLTVKTPESGNYTIKRSQIQGTGNLKITLTDKLSGKNIDLLSVAEYSFNVSAGITADRFYLTITPEVKKVTLKTDQATTLKIFSSAGRVCVLPQGTGWDGVKTRVRIFDVTGRLIVSADDQWFNAGERYEYYPAGSSGMLIVEVIAGEKRYLEKIIHSKN